MEATDGSRQIGLRDGAGLDDCRRWPDSLAQRRTGGSPRIYRQSRAKVRGGCLVQHLGTSEIDQLGMQLLMKAAGQEAKPEPAGASDQGAGQVADRCEAARPVGWSLSIDAQFYFQCSRS